MIWGGIATLLSLIVQPLGQIAGWVAWVFLTYTIEVVQLTARVPFASVLVLKRYQVDAVTFRFTFSLSLLSLTNDS